MSSNEYRSVKTHLEPVDHICLLLVKEKRIILYTHRIMNSTTTSCPVANFLPRSQSGLVSIHMTPESPTGQLLLLDIFTSHIFIFIFIF